MSKKLENLKWASVPIDGFPISMSSKFQGFVGLEECTSYGLDKGNKQTKKEKKKRKSSEPHTNVTINKKIKLDNGFIVEDCHSVAPSKSDDIVTSRQRVMTNHKETNKTKDNKISEKIQDKINTNNNNKTNGFKKIKKPKLGEPLTETVSNLTPEDMLTWAEFKLPEEILKALAELGFKKPTKIQQLSLPAAIHGRRDILGAAETGSGKTLAFGLPILSGIMKLKEKASVKGLDVYEIPYKKTSMKKRNLAQEEKVKNKKEINSGKTKVKKDISKAKESSEDGYGSGDESENEMEKSGKKIVKRKDKVTNEHDDYLQEIVVPLRKKESSIDEGKDSDSDDNYVHLSEMIDSDDLAETSDDDNDETDNEDEIDTNADKEENSTDEFGSDEETDSQNELDNEEGIGCVKVIDDIEIPGHVITKTGKLLYALILTPTRELAIQISRHLIAVAKYTGIKVATIVGGMAAVKQERVLRSGPEIVVATPGRLWELINQGQSHLQQLDSVKFLAIDETDRMIERNHFEELQPILERLNADEDRRSSRQNFVFSATLTMVHDLPTHMKGKKVTKRGKIINRKVEKMTAQQKIKRLVDLVGMTDPKVVDITAQNLGTAESLTECSIACSFDHKDSYLYYILKRHPGRTIVFCNSIGCVKRLSQLLTILKCRPLPLHASMPQRQRLKNLERFRDDGHGVLVATDVAARGLDIPDVDHVIHYQVPRTAENYVHRSGRTARANKEGLTILMMEPAEAFLYSKLCRTLNKASVLPPFPVPGHLLNPMRELVTLAREVDSLELRKRRSNQEAGWREKVARDMDIIIDDDVVPMKKVDPTIDKALKAKRRQLESMISKPLFPKGFSYKYPTLNDATALDAPEENALQVMKNAINSGELKKEKRKGKNAALIKLEKQLNN